MALKSNFESDLKKEQKLTVLLDAYYAKYLKHYSFERIHDLKRQFLGIDVIFTHKTTGESFFIDEKAQLDYINETLPTFAFELQYLKKEEKKEGWLFSVKKETQFYALVTNIFSDEEDTFTSCKITLVNREKLLKLLETKGVSQAVLDKYISCNTQTTGKLPVKELHEKKEGYLYFSTTKKAEKPINLVLKLRFLLRYGVAKELC